RRFGASALDSTGPSVPVPAAGALDPASPPVVRVVLRRVAGLASGVGAAVLPAVTPAGAAEARGRPRRGATAAASASPAAPAPASPASAARPPPPPAARTGRDRGRSSDGAPPPDFAARFAPSLAPHFGARPLPCP